MQLQRVVGTGVLQWILAGIVLHGQQRGVVLGGHGVVREACPGPFGGDLC